MRVDKWLKERFPSLSGRQIEEAIEKGLVEAPRGGNLKKGGRVPEGAELVTTKLADHVEKLSRGNRALELTVLHETADFAIVDKPAGMPTHPISLFDFETVTHWALARYPELRSVFPEAQPTVTPHRLDTGTSGLVVVARTRAGFDRWRERFASHKVTKRYLAWCWGEPLEPEFTIDKPIGHMPGDKRRMVAIDALTAFVPPSRDALSFVKVMKMMPERGLFLAEVRCSTGVTHQVRVHLAHRGFPLVGDALYDPESSSRPETPPFHQLRSFELLLEGEKYTAPTETFERQFA